jgi:TonB family protein
VVKSTPQPAPAFPFRLTVEAQGTGLNIDWDAQSPAVAQAHEGQLTITETGTPAVVIPLTTQQLTIGHIYFQSSAERVEVQLETLDATGKPSRESVLAFSPVPRPSAPAVASVQQPKPAAPAPQPAWLPARKVETFAIPGRNVSATEAPEVPRVERSASRAFKAPSLNRTPSRLPVIDQPATAWPPQSLAVPMPLNTGVLSTRVAPPPQQTAPQRIKVTSSLQAARLVRKVAPVYPQVAIAGRVQGEVRFTAIIARDGTVRDLKQTAGPSILGKAATAAVNQWTYQPTLLDGQPVEVATEIDVNFTLSQ